MNIKVAAFTVSEKSSNTVISLLFPYLKILNALCHPLMFFQNQPFSTIILRIQSELQTVWTQMYSLFVWFDSLRPINNLSFIKGRVFLGRTSIKLGLMFLLKDTTQWRRWDSNPRPFGLESSFLPLSPRCTVMCHKSVQISQAPTWIFF